MKADRNSISDLSKGQEAAVKKSNLFPCLYKTEDSRHRYTVAAVPILFYWSYMKMEDGCKIILHHTASRDGADGCIYP